MAETLWSDPWKEGLSLEERGALVKSLFPEKTAADCGHKKLIKEWMYVVEDALFEIGEGNEKGVDRAVQLLDQVQRDMESMLVS